ncbi:MAG: response regulator [Melioribacteraceae bacterium]|nr:response regulator [Melioribacteraceae bacterium]
MKILIVDDNSHMRLMIKSLFTQSQSEFFECDDGLNSIEMCEQHNPDYVLMDFKMKYVDGITATKNIKKKFPHIKIIMVSNYSDEDLSHEAKCAGAEFLLPKEDLYLLPNYFIEKLV